METKECGHHLRTLYDRYASAHPPPVMLLRYPGLVDLLVEQLFVPSHMTRTTLSDVQLTSHVFTLAYAVAVPVSESGTDESTRERHHQKVLDHTVEGLSSAYKALCAVM